MTLSEWLKKNKITQTEFAERHGFSRATIHNICKHRYRPNKNNAKRIEKLTHGKVSITVLLSYKPQKPSVKKQLR